MKRNRRPSHSHKSFYARGRSTEESYRDSYNKAFSKDVSKDTIAIVFGILFLVLFISLVVVYDNAKRPRFEVWPPKDDQSEVIYVTEIPEHHCREGELAVPLELEQIVACYRGCMLITQPIYNNCSITPCTYKYDECIESCDRYYKDGRNSWLYCYGKTPEICSSANRNRMVDIMMNPS